TPMCGGSRFGNHVHISCTNLHFDRQTISSKYNRMQTLITIPFWDCNIIFKATNNMLVELMHHPKYTITLISCRDDHANGKDIVYQFNFALNLKLIVNTPQMFLPRRDSRQNITTN